MKTKELTDWHNNVFRPAYSKMLLTPFRTKWGPGGNGKSLSKILRMKPSEQLRTEIIRKIKEITEHREELFQRLGKDGYEKYTKKQATSGNGDVYKNCLIPSWLNAMGWVESVPGIPTYLSEKVQRNKKCYCGADVHGPAFDHCVEHIPSVRLVK